MKIIMRYLVTPTANTFRSFGAISLTIYLCKEQILPEIERQSEYLLNSSLISLK